DFAGLEQTMAELDDSSTIEDLVTADIAFHHLINTRCPNDYLSTLLDSLASSTSRARIWRGLTDDSAIERTLSEHRRILDALRARRPDLARTYAAAHIAGVESLLLVQREPPPQPASPRRGPPAPGRAAGFPGRAGARRGGSRHGTMDTRR